VLAGLEQRFTIIAMDRRGRGASGDGPTYALEREAEDVAAVADALAEPVNVLGYSYGGLCALEASRLSSRLHRLIVYEGVRAHGADPAEEAAAERLDAMLAAGDAEGMLAAFLRDVVGMPSEEFDLLRSQHEAWATRLRNAPSVPRELREIARYVFAPERFRGMRVPTVLLVGGASPPAELDDAAAVARALPDARVVVLPGQQHIAMLSAPDVFVAAVVEALLA
jgi:pimeloyl-ACP methyl ester carboxylesterase